METLSASVVERLKTLEYEFAESVEAGEWTNSDALRRDVLAFILRCLCRNSPAQITKELSLTELEQYLVIFGFPKPAKVWKENDSFCVCVNELIDLYQATQERPSLETDPSMVDYYIKQLNGNLFQFRSDLYGSMMFPEIPVDISSVKQCDIESITRRKELKVIDLKEKIVQLKAALDEIGTHPNVSNSIRGELNNAVQVLLGSGEELGLRIAELKPIIEALPKPILTGIGDSVSMAAVLYDELVQIISDVLKIDSLSVPVEK